SFSSSLFLFTAPSPSDFYTLSLHDALPILLPKLHLRVTVTIMRDDFFDLPIEQREIVLISKRTIARIELRITACEGCNPEAEIRSEEHTSELQSRSDLVCRLLLEKKKKQQI